MYEKVQKFLNQAGVKALESDKAAAVGDEGKGVANQRILEAQGLAAKAILEAAGLDKTHPTVVADLDRRFQQLEEQIGPLEFPATSDRIVKMAQRQISDSTPLDPGCEEKEIKSAKKFIVDARRFLNEFLPPLVWQGLKDWEQAVPLEDPRGGASY